MLSLFARLTGFVARQTATHVAAALVVLTAAVPAAAQTLQLADANATTIRGGTYADTNFAGQTIVETRASGDASYIRRVLLKFDTQTTIPLGTPVASATLTMTVAGGNAESRTLGAYRVPDSYDEAAATWKKRNSSTYWGAAGADTAGLYARAAVTNVAGSKVTFDITSLVKENVSGANGSNRYTRVVLVDSGASSQSSYKQYYSEESGAQGPILTVVLGSTPAPTPTPTPTGSGVQLRVLQWNVHHGVGTDGRYDIDRLATWMAKMTPDVVTLNEVERFTSWGNEDQPAHFRSLLQSKTGKTWYYHFAQEYGNWSSPGKGHLILSRYPFDATAHETITPSSGLNGAGAVSEARITVNGRTINLILGHLDPSSSTMRLTQAREVISFASTFAENRIVTGDMNAWPDQSSIAEYNKTYSDSWSVATSKGTAYQFSGLSPDGATKKGRIDYIFLSKSAPNLVVLSSKVYDTRDSSGYMPSDHRPVVTTFDVR